MKTRLAQSAEALMAKAEECLDIAKAQHDSAEAQHDSADKLEAVVDSLLTEAAVLNGAALVPATKSSASG